MRVDDLDVVDVDGGAGPADDARVSGLAYPLPDLILHLDLVPLRQDGDARSLAALVGGDQLGYDREDLGRPPEDDRMPPLNNERPALAQLVQLVVYARGDDPDQGAEDEDPTHRDRQHREQERPATLIPAHIARVDGPHQVEPEGLEETELASLGLRRDAGRADEQSARKDQRRNQGEEPADQGDGAPGDRVVEPVAQPVGERDPSHTPSVRSP